LGTRFVAYLIDSVVITLIAVLPVVLVWYTDLSPAVIATVASVLMLAWVVLVWWMFAVRGAGPGMRLMHLQLVGLANGRPIGWGRFLLRQLILIGLSLTGIGLLLMVVFLAQHPRRQGWHDLAVNSVVIRERQLARSRPTAQPRHAATPDAGLSAVGQPAQPPGQPAGSGSVSPSALAPPPQFSSPDGGAAGYPSAQGTPAGHPSPQGGPVGYPSPQRAPDRRPPTAGALPGGTPPPYEPVSRSVQGRPSDSVSQPLQPSGYGSPPPPLSPPQAQPGSPFGAGQPGAGQPGAGQPGAGQPGTGQAGPAQPVGRPASVPFATGSGPEPVLGAGSEPGRLQPAPSSATSWRAVLDDGRQIPISGLVLLGRNPQARPGEEHATLIKVADTTRTVSKSHLEINLDPRGLHVVDRGSTNGSTVTSVSGVTRRCPPGEPIAVEPGSIVSFGDHWLEVRRD
jgi:uncharacterized RDD family membrane protein YckC